MVSTESALSGDNSILQSSSPETVATSLDSSVPSTQTAIPIASRRSSRSFVPPSYLNDYDNSPPTKSPLDRGVKLSSAPNEFMVDATPYRRLIGKLNFITQSKPNISFVVQHLIQFMHSPTPQHYKAAMHTLLFLKGTMNFGLLLNNTPDYKLQGYCDSDWASCVCT
ncbi:hypothetical protein V2J09_021070 [Rumex salicifolius]